MIPTLFCQVNDEGIDIVIKFTDGTGAIFPLNSTDVIAVRLRYPDGSSRDFVARLFTDGADGKAVYTTGTGDVPQEGIYNVQASLSRDGNLRNTRRGTFQALANVDG